MGEYRVEVDVPENDLNPGTAAPLEEVYGVSDFVRRITSMDPAMLSDADLIATLLQGTTGTRDALDVANQLLVSCRGNVDALTRSRAYTQEVGLGPAGKARLLAAAELYRRATYRAMAQDRMLDRPITTASDVVDLLRTMAFGDSENLVGLYLDRRRRFIHGRVLTVGSDAFTVVDPRQIFRPAIEFSASAVILAHNHQSGDPTPSMQDREVTRRTNAAGKVLGVALLDHIVLGSGYRWSSLAEEGALPPWHDSPGWTAEP
jgi:DNA repair protein RadC